MNNNEFMAKVTEMVMQDPSVRESLKKLYDELAQIEPSTEQKPDMMYVLTQRVKVATENGEEIYHYHPLVGECLLVPGAVKNQMVCSGNLLELQTLQKSERLSHMCGMREDFQILALKPDEFELLQLLLDETITSIIDNTHKAVEALMLNEAYLGVESISFEKIYQNVMFDLMSKAHGTFGSALSADSEIIEKIDGVKYEYPQPTCCGYCCGDEYDEDEEDDYDDEEDDDDDGCSDEVYIVRRTK